MNIIHSGLICPNDPDIVLPQTHHSSLHCPWQNRAYKRNASVVIGYVKLLLY